MRGWRLLLPLGAVLLLAGGAFVGDWYAQNRELDRLLHRIESAEETINRYGPATQSIFADYEGGPLPPEVWTRLAAAAEASSRDVVDKVDGVDDLRFLPWHNELDRARDRYVHHAGLWLDYLEGVVRDAESNHRASLEEIFETYRMTLADLRRAIPARPSQDFDARITALEPN